MMKKLYFLLAIIFTSVLSKAQTCSNTVSSNDGGNNGVRISKCLMTNYLSPTGSNIQYDINFSTQGAVGNIVIEDLLDSNIQYVSSTQPSFLGTPTILGNTVKWNGIAPTGGYAYNIRLTVRFKAEETCDGVIAPNIVSISANNIPKVTTNAINVEAEAIDDWTITKTAVRPGKVYLPGETVEFEIVINGGGAIGKHQLTNITIQDIVTGGGANVINFGCLNLNGSTLSPSGLRCRIKVKYFENVWKDGDCATNTIKLTGINPCGELITVTDTETICFKKDYIAPPLIGTASTSKIVSITNPVAGCSGIYQMELRNTGTKDLPDLTLNDVFPSGITVNNITLDNFNGNSYEYSVNNGSTWNGPITSASYNVPLTFLPFSGIRIRASGGSGAILANSTIRITAGFTVNSGTTIGQVILNTVTISCPSESISNQASASFTVEDYKPKIRLTKSICNSNGSYEPGDELVYRIKVENYGSDAFIGGNLTDVLDSRLQFMGITNVKVYKPNNGGTPPCSNNGVLGSSVTDLTSNSIINFNSSNNTLNLNLPTVNANCATNESIWIEFRVKVKPGVPHGSIPNNSSLTNGTINLVSNTVYITVIELYTLRVGKLISVDGGLTYSAGPIIVPAGTPIKYKIEIENIGNSSIQNINLIDILPHNSDVNISLGTLRGSTIGGLLLSPISVPSGFQIYYSNNSCPDTSFEFGSVSCSGSSPAMWSTTFSPTVKSFKISSNSYILTPLSLISFVLDVEVPPNGITGDLMCNSANARGKQLNGIDTQVFGSETVCLEIIAPDINCCQSDLNFTNKQGYDAFSEDYTRVHNIIEISGAPSLPLIPISEIRITMSDIDITYDYEDCAKCIDNPKLWGSMEGLNNIGAGMSDTVLFKDTQNYVPNSNYGFREIVWSKWSSSAGRIIQYGDMLEFYTYLPPRSKIPCCATSIEICYTISWKDANCNVCEKKICKKISLESQKKKILK